MWKTRKKKSGCFSCNVRNGILNVKNLQLNKCIVCFDLVTKRVISKALSNQNNIIKTCILFSCCTAARKWKMLSESSVRNSEMSHLTIRVSKYEKPGDLTNENVRRQYHTNSQNIYQHQESLFIPMVQFGRAALNEASSVQQISWITKIETWTSFADAIVDRVRFAVGKPISVVQVLP